MDALQAKLEEFGFYVTRAVSLNPAILQITATVELWVPKSSGDDPS